MTERPPSGPTSRRPPRSSGGLAAYALFGGMAGLVLVAGLWVAQGLLRPSSPVSSPNAPAFSVPAPADALADASTILAWNGQGRKVFRFANNPRIVVVVFPSLHDQGQALNRVAVFVEKKGAPHDRVLSEAEMADYLRRTGETEDGFYDGHDYRIADLRRFFGTAAADGIALRPEEAWMQALVARETAPGIADPAGAVITLTAPDTGVDAAARETILRHELAHGRYFTEPAYAAFAAAFWTAALTPAEQAEMRRFLAGEGYDPANGDLMQNEAQAYLVFTRDPRFFRADKIGMSEQRLAQLRALFRAGMPKDPSVISAR